MGELAKNGIPFQKMRQRLCVRKIIDRYNLDVLIALRRAEYISTDPAEPVDTNFYRHDALLGKIVASSQF
jgi:DNA-directed RNA polymerase subunit K/omega